MQLYQHYYEIPPYDDAPITRAALLVIGMWYVMGEILVVDPCLYSISQKMVVAAVAINRSQCQE
jgi:hypothetical protein